MVVTLLVLMLVLGVSSAAHAESIAGVCPDGSMYIVKKEADIPCARSKRVDPSEMPPMRPQLLPRPYTWHVDQQSRDPHNPYNLIDPAAKIRAFQARARRIAPPLQARWTAVAALALAPATKRAVDQQAGRSGE